MDLASDHWCRSIPSTDLRVQQRDSAPAAFPTLLSKTDQHPLPVRGVDPHCKATIRRVITEPLLGSARNSSSPA